MTAISLLEELAGLGVEVSIDGAQLRLSAPRGAVTPELQARIRAERDALMAALTSVQGLVAEPYSGPIPSLPPTKPVALSHAQRRLWFLDQLSPGTALLNLPGCLRLVGKLDVDAFRWAVGELPRRHDALATAVELVEGEPHGVLRDVKARLELEDLSLEEPEDRAATFERRRLEEASLPFDSTQAPLVRFRLFQLAPEEHMLVFTASHLIFDGSSHDVLLRDLRHLYQVRLLGRSTRESSAVRFRDLVEWQRHQRSLKDTRPEVAYWTSHLEGMPHVLEMPLDRPRPASMSYQGHHAVFVVEGELLERLRAVARVERATMSMLGLAAAEIVLWRFSGQLDFGVGVPVQGRTHPDSEALVGMFVNTLVVRSALPGGGRFRDLLGRVGQRFVQALSHQDVPFDQIVQAVRPSRDPSRTPLFQAMFSAQRATDRDFDLCGLKVTDVPAFSSAAATDITFWTFEYEDRLVAAIETASALFDLDSTERFARSFRRVLEAVAADPEALLSDVPFLAEPDQRHLLIDLNDTQAPWEEFALIHRWFERAVDVNGGSTALIFEEQRFSFAELDCRANQLAQVLGESGVGPDSLVGVYLQRSPELVIALLAVLKAGGAYVPLDPAYPAERVSYILGDSNAKLLVSSVALAAHLEVRPQTILCDRDAADIASHSTARLFREEHPNQLAYVIHTSGSTGKPKGVMVEHQNVISFLVGMQRAIALDGRGVWLSGTSTSFDISVLELFGSLCHGRTVALLGETVLGQAEDSRYAIPSLIKRHRVTHFQCTPSQIRILLLDPAGRSALGSLQQLVVGGEAMPPDLAKDLVELLGERVVNAYGPTETTVWSTTAVLRAREPVTIGRPIANTIVFILDEMRRPVPFGAVGELWIGGPGVTRGYLARPELTAERFIENQLRPDLGGRLYRTGDLVRYAKNGQLVYLGRNDHQVKIRGFRIEIGEIESVIRRVPGVTDVVIVVRGEATDKRLIAYLVLDDEYAGDAVLRTQLRHELPENMVPAVFARLEALPLTPNGKVDRNALPEPSATLPQADHEYVSPADEIERELQAIWQEALGLPRLSVTADFFESGGHSLLAVRIFNDVHAKFGVRMPLALLFERPTVRRLAEKLSAVPPGEDGANQATWSTAVPIRRSGSLPPFFCVAGLGGNPLNLRHIAASIGDYQPFWALQHRGVDGKLAPHRSVQSMAAEFVEDIRRVQSTGPYYLGGYSAGGLAAYEAARVLLESGDSVGLLVLFDTSNPATLRWSPRARLYSHLANFRRIGPAYLAKRARAKLLWGMDACKRVVRARLATFFPFEYRNDALVDAGLEAERQYLPELYQGDVLLIKADSVAPPYAGIGYPPHESNGWRELVRGNLEIARVKSSHLELVSDTVAPIAARFVREALNRSYASHGIVALDNAGSKRS